MRAFFVASVIVACLILLLLVDKSFGIDQSIFFLAGQSILAGGTIYIDLYDIKPPAIYYIYAGGIAVFGDSELAIKLTETVTLLLTTVLAAFAMHKLVDWRAGILAMLLTLFSLNKGPNWISAQTETFALPLLAAGIVALLWAPPKGLGRWLSWTGAAALLTSPIFLKPTLGGGLVASFLFVLISLDKGSQLRMLPTTVSTHVIGALLAIVIGYTIFEGTAGAFSGYISVASEYYGAYAPDSGFLSIPVAFVRAIQKVVEVHPHFAVGIFLLFALHDWSRSELGKILLLLAMLVMMLLGTAVQLRLVPYHFNAVFLPASLLAAWGYWLLMQRAPRQVIGVTSCSAIILMSLLIGGSLRPVIKGTLTRLEALNDSDILVAESLYWGEKEFETRAMKIVENFDLKDGEPIFIWGSDAPLLYFHGRHHFSTASRVIVSSHLRVFAEETALHTRVLGDLEDSRPRVGLFQENDSEAHIQAGMPDSYQHMRTVFTGLGNLMNETYRSEGKYLKYQVYKFDKEI